MFLATAARGRERSGRYGLGVGAATVKAHADDTAAFRDRSPMKAALAFQAPATDGMNEAFHLPLPSAPTWTVTGVEPVGPVNVTETGPRPLGEIRPEAVEVDPTVPAPQAIETDEVLGREGAFGVRRSAEIFDERTVLPLTMSTSLSALADVPLSGIVSLSVRPPGTLKKPL